MLKRNWLRWHVTFLLFLSFLSPESQRRRQELQQHLRPGGDIGNGNRMLTRLVGRPGPWRQCHCHNNLGPPITGYVLSDMSAHGTYLCWEGRFMDLETGSQRVLSNLPKVSPPFRDSNPVPDRPMLSVSERLDYNVLEVAFGCRAPWTHYSWVFLYHHALSSL